MAAGLVMLEVVRAYWVMSTASNGGQRTLRTSSIVPLLTHPVLLLRDLRLCMQTLVTGRVSGWLTAASRGARSFVTTWPLRRECAGNECMLGGGFGVRGRLVAVVVEGIELVLYAGGVVVAALVPV